MLLISCHFVLFLFLFCCNSPVELENLLVWEITEYFDSTSAIANLAVFPDVEREAFFIFDNLEMSKFDRVMKE